MDKLSKEIYGGGGTGAGRIRINQNRRTIFTYPHPNPKEASKHINSKLKEMGYSRDSTGLYARPERLNKRKININTKATQEENILLGRDKKTVKEAKNLIKEILKDFISH
jgi:hypothetical protein